MKARIAAKPAPKPLSKSADKSGQIGAAKSLSKTADPSARTAVEKTAQAPAKKTLPTTAPLEKPVQTAAAKVAAKVTPAPAEMPVRTLEQEFADLKGRLVKRFDTYHLKVDRKGDKVEISGILDLAAISSAAASQTGEIRALAQVKQTIAAAARASGKFRSIQVSMIGPLQHVRQAVALDLELTGVSIDEIGVDKSGKLIINGRAPTFAAKTRARAAVQDILKSLFTLSRFGNFERYQNNLKIPESEEMP